MMSNNTSSLENTAEYLQRLDEQYSLQALPAIVFLVLLMLVGLTGNLLVFYVYVAKFKSSTTTNFISALAFLDLFNCLVNIPFEIADMSHNYTFGNSPLCKIMPLLVTFISIASGSILVAVAIDRFRKICRPLRRQATARMGNIQVFICCGFSAAVSLPAAFLYGPREVKVSEWIIGSECNVSDKSRQTILPVVYNAVQFFIFLVSTIVLIVLYSLVWGQLSKQQKFRKVLSPNGHPQMRRIPNKDSSSATSTTREETLTSSSSTNTNMNSVSRDQQNVDVKSDNADNKYAQNDAVEKEEVSESQEPNTQRPKTSSNATKPLQFRLKKGAQRTTLMLFVITVVFVLSFLPYLGLMAANAVNKHLYDSLHGAQVAAYNLFQRSYFINSATNPVVYSFCSVRFRRQLGLLFKRH